MDLCLCVIVQYILLFINVLNTERAKRARKKYVAYEPSCVLRTIFWHVKDFGVARDGAAEGLKISRRTYDG